MNNIGALFQNGRGVPQDSRSRCSGTKKKLLSATTNSESVNDANTLKALSGSWVSTIEVNAMNALRKAFTQFPVMVQLASSHTSYLSTAADQGHIVGTLGGKYGDRRDVHRFLASLSGRQKRGTSRLSPHSSCKKGKSGPPNLLFRTGI